jgi:hypothetical protein
MPTEVLAAVAVLLRFGRQIGTETVEIVGKGNTETLAYWVVVTSSNPDTCDALRAVVQAETDKKQP